MFTILYKIMLRTQLDRERRGSWFHFLREDEKNWQELSREMTGKVNARNVTEEVQISRLEADWKRKAIIPNLINLMHP